MGFFGELGRKINPQRRPIIPDAWQNDVLASEADQKILNTSRQVGKSTVIGGIALHAGLFADESLTLVFGPTERQSKELFAKIARLYLAYLEDDDDPVSFATPRDRMRRAVGYAREVRKMGLTLPNGSRIEALPATAYTARGYTPDVIIVDEAAYCTNEFYEGITPSQAVVSDYELVLASTPYGKRGFFYEEWEDGEDFERYEVPYHDCPRISDRFIHRERSRSTPRKFRQEYLCSFEETEDQVFSHAVIENAFTDEAPLWEE